MADYPPLRLDSRMPFGKYKGFTLREIGRNDKSYVIWIHEKTTAKLDFNPYTADYSEEEDLLLDYLKKHPNPYNLEFDELKKAVMVSLTIVKKKGEPGLDDWDDTQYAKPDFSSYYGSVY